MLHKPEGLIYIKESKEKKKFLTPKLIHKISLFHEMHVAFVAPVSPVVKDISESLGCGGFCVVR